MEELYKVLYDYDAQRNDELSLKVGDIVHIIQYDSEEWCVAENMETKQEGAVPTNFLEKLNSGQNNTTIDNGPILAKVLQDYTAQDPEELSLWKNGIITILDQSIADGWWKGDLNGKTGIFPSNHVKLIDAHEQSMDVDENDKNKRQSFKLAAYGVKQGGIGSILAGGFNLRKKTSKKDAVPQEEIPSSSLNQQHQIPTLSDNSSQEEADKQSPDIREKAMVISSYDPQNHDELQLVPGGYITIVDKLDDQGWWKGLNEKNEEGVFPSNFVQILPQEGTPVRPARARPPTIKTDSPNTQPQPSVTSPTGLAKPPAVPTGTRPSSLLTRRPPTTSTAEQSAPPLPRPTTSPPVPSRRTNSVIKEQHPPASHKRTPSIPLVSPDLPPIRQDYAHDQHPVRPSRPVPSPSSAASNMTTPISPTSEDKTFGLAKPPKNFGKQQVGPMAPPRTSRPNSQASSVHTQDTTSLQGLAEEHKSENDDIPAPLPPPRGPKRSIPPVPSRQSISEEEPLTGRHSRETSYSSTASKNEDKPVSSPPVILPTRSIGSFHSSNKNDDDISSVTSSSIDPLENKIRQWFKEEVESMRQDFESRLEEERSQRIKLELELEALKKQLL